MKREEARKLAKELVGKMTLEEKASQLRYDAPAIPRLGVPAYNWWNEALHGVARAGTATMFPQAIGMAAMFDEPLMKEIGDVISTEARAKFNMQAAHEDRDIYKGLTMWSPNINIFRDPRWGRGHETYGEDPYLTSRLGVQFIEGLQGEGEYLKTAACAKHFAVHSGPEGLRHSFDAKATPKDMWETYLPAFEVAVEEAGVESVMGAYNRTNGEPCCGSKTLLRDILRGKWNFQGHIVSDCWAIRDFHTNHMVTHTATESAALALENGCDINCGVTYLHMMEAYQEGLVTEEQITEAAVHAFTTQYMLGLFDENCEYNAIPYSENDSPAHQALNLKASRESVVLLKNDGILPLSREKIHTLAVIGPTADNVQVLKGNYHGSASQYITIHEGIRAAAGDGIRMVFSEGCHLYKDKLEPLSAGPNDRLSEADAVARMADVVILCLGLDSTLEGEEGDTGNSYAAGDKLDLLLPEPQRALLETVAAAGKPVVVVLTAGSAMDLSYAQEHCSAIVQAWYPGALGGRAVGEILFGDVNPSGRLPVTFYSSENTLPDIKDYSMKGRTYRYMEEKPLYPFGYGLSYTSFAYSGLEAPASVQAGESLTVSVNVKNTGAVEGDEVVEAYISRKGLEDQPIRSLCGFARVHLKASEEKKVELTVSPRSMLVVAEDGSRSIPAGECVLSVGGGQPDERTLELTGSPCLEASFRVEGSKAID